MNIILRKAYNTIMVEGLESTCKNLVSIVRDVYVFVGSFTYIMDFVILEDIGEFILRDMAEVVMGKPFRKVTKLEYDHAKGLMLYLMRTSLDVLRKFHMMILGGRFNQLSHVSSPLLSKPGILMSLPWDTCFKQRMQAARDRQKSYADLKRKPMEFQVGDKTIQGDGKRLDLLLTKLEFPQEPSKVHNMFHVSNLKKCYADEPLAVPLDGLHLDDKLHFVEEPLEIVGREVKRLKRSRIPLVKVRWNSKRGPEFTWEREDQFKKKYPHLFTKTTPSSSAAS
ncbi:hypothetical protein Tco_0368288 [Tanacetum coccineum]